MVLDEGLDCREYSNAEHGNYLGVAFGIVGHWASREMRWLGLREGGYLLYH